MAVRAPRGNAAFGGRPEGCGRAPSGPAAVGSERSARTSLHSRSTDHPCEWARGGEAMTRAFAVAALVMAFARSTEAGGVQLFNTEVLGMPTAKPVKLFRDKEAGDAEPYVVWTDVACGEYDAASVFYRHPVTFQHVRDALNKLYGAFETPNPSSADRAQVPFSKDPPMMALWRIVDPRITSEERA